MKQTNNAIIAESYQHLTCRSSLLEAPYVENSITKFLIFDMQGILDYQDTLRPILDNMHRVIFHHPPNDNQHRTHKVVV